MSETSWTETAVGAGLLAAGIWLASHILHHPEHSHRWAWGFAGGLVLSGLALVAPVRTRWLVAQLRDALPVLEDTDE